MSNNVYQTNFIIASVSALPGGGSGSGGVNITYHSEDTVDDFPVDGDSLVEYIARDTGKHYRWDGNDYVMISTQGDMTKAVYDTDNDGLVDDSTLVDGHQVKLDVTNVEISNLEASDDWDNA